MHLVHRHRRSLLLLSLSSVIALGVIWLLWPVECITTGIGFEPGTANPNLQFCERRIGTTADQDGVHLSAIAWGVGTGLTILFTNAVSTRVSRSRSA